MSIQNYNSFFVFLRSPKNCSSKVYLKFIKYYKDSIWNYRKYALRIHSSRIYSFSKKRKNEKYISTYFRPNALRPNNVLQCSRA